MSRLVFGSNRWRESEGAAAKVESKIISLNTKLFVNLQHTAAQHNEKATQNRTRDGQQST